MPYRLLPSFQSYSWGDLSFIQNLCNLPDMIGSPIAEMWMGAHPRSSSLLQVEGSSIPLSAAIAAHPYEHLGRAYGLYEGRLPFLFKVLAAARPLSIQLHPDRETAVKGFKAENEAGIALDAPQRTFKDDNHKPELICALTPFTMLCGFRDYQEIIAMFVTFSLANALPSAGDFIQHPHSHTLKQLYHEVMHLQPEEIKQLLEAKILGTKTLDPKHRELIETCRSLQRFFPADVGVLAPLFLNIITLQPGMALFLKAGILHSYLHGAGLELMANSDNVIRGGLTDKYINLDALLAIADFSPYPAQILSPIPQRGMDIYPGQTPEFQLGIITLEGSITLPNDNSPHIILVLAGAVIIPGLGALNQGEAAYYPASELSIELQGKAKVAVVGTAIDG